MYDREKLTETLVEMKQDYFKDPQKATRSQSFIRKIHEYCRYELEKRGIDQRSIHLEKRISGSHSEKSVDVAVMRPQNGAKEIVTGPLLTISIKSQMSSIGKNFQTVYDRIIGEVLNLHNRFPLLVANCLYLYPTHGYTKQSGKRYSVESIDFEKLSRKYALVTGRKNPSDAPDKHEHLALLVVDFDTEPPSICGDLVHDKVLVIDDFFDKILKNCIERNPSLLS